MEQPFAGMLSKRCRTEACKESRKVDVRQRRRRRRGDRSRKAKKEKERKERGDGEKSSTAPQRQGGNTTSKRRQTSGSVYLLRAHAHARRNLWRL